MFGLRLVAPVLLLLVLAACPKDGGAGSAGGTGPATPVIETPVSTTATPANEPAPPQATQGAVTEQAKYAAVALTGLTNERLEDGQVKGSWVGLFGQDDIGAIERAWADGHRVDFLPDGQAIWSRLTNGVVTSTMDSQWVQTGGQLSLSFPAEIAVQSGLAELAPLGLAPPDAGGATIPPAGAESSFNPMESSLEIALYPSYLVLSDKFGRMMIYGRLAEADPAVGAQGLAGDWTASCNGQADGTANIGFADGNMLLSGWAQGEFTGTHISGYFVGRLTQPGGNVGFAAATSNEHTAGHIHGIICEGPYAKMHIPFEFIR